VTSRQHKVNGRLLAVYDDPHLLGTSKHYPIFFTHFVWRDGGTHVLTRAELVNAWKLLLGAHDAVYCIREDLLWAVSHSQPYLSGAQCESMMAASKTILEELDPVLLAVEAATCECKHPLLHTLQL
jgi:hypothetical protein